MIQIRKLIMREINFLVFSLRFADMYINKFKCTWPTFNLSCPTDFKFQVDEVAYTDKTRNVALVIGVKDVKSDIKDNNRLTFPRFQVDEVMYTDKTRNVAIVLGVKDVKSDIKDKNRLSFALQTGLPTLLYI